MKFNIRRRSAGECRIIPPQGPLTCTLSTLGKRRIVSAGGQGHDRYMDIFGDSMWGMPSGRTLSTEAPVDIAIRAKKRGAFPADGTSKVGGVAVPPGFALRPERYKIWEGPGKETLSDELPHIGWYTPTDWDRTGALWGDLARAFKRTGLWPVVGGPGNRCGDPEHEFSGQSPSRDHGDEASNVLQGCWDGMRLVNGETGEPVPERRPPFPGIGPGTPPAGNVESVPLAQSGGWGSGYGGVEAGILLVPATRPADVPQLVGWTGPCNHDLAGRDISAVLRSWEDRFGAVLYELGRTTMTLRVARPPTTLAGARAVMEEHYLLCFDNFCSQDGNEPLSKDEYAQRLVNAPVWDFWWD